MPPTVENDLLSANVFSQVIRAIPKSMVPLSAAYGPTSDSSDSFAAKSPKEPDSVSGFLEVVHLAEKKVTYIPVPPVQKMSSFMHWLNAISDVQLVMAPMPGKNSLVTVDAGGSVRMWETSRDKLLEVGLCRLL